MENDRKFELNDNVLDEVAGGRDGFAGSLAAQDDTVPVVLPPILLHPDPRPKEEDENKRIVPGIVGHL